MKTTSIKLKPEELKKLRQIRKTHKSSIVRDRAHVILLKHKKKTIKEIMEILDRSDNFVKHSLSLFKQGCVSGLITTKTGGNNRKLVREQKDKIKQQLDQSPQTYGYQEDFWSLKVFRDFLLKNYNLVYKSDQSYYDLLDYCGYSYQKPIKKDLRQDPHMVKRFEKNIKKNSKNTKIRLYW